MIDKLVRDNIRNLKPYTSARDIYNDGILLDANENSFGSAGQPYDVNLNRYPDPHQISMRETLGKMLKVSSENIFFGVGSDEIIDLLIRIFCNPGKDSILVAEPTYGMYRVSADINNIKTNTVYLDQEFQIDVKAVLNKITKSTKIIFLCSPNNPTGGLLNLEAIKELLRNPNCIVVVDEAYIDFAQPENSCSCLLNDFPNLIILRTFSKAWGLAGIRLGYCIADKKIISYLFKIKTPYNINTLTRNAFHKAVAEGFPEKLVMEILKEKEYLISELKKIKEVEKIFPSDANFILIKINNASAIQKSLAEKGVIVRDRSSQSKLENTLRITVGSHEQNKRLIDLMSNKPSVNNKSNDKLSRTAEVIRNTNETKIKVRVSLDGKEESNINTGIGFFDHMLAQIARHGNIGIDVITNGDLEVDEHHSVEDTGLALGEAISKALGKKDGIKRYGFFLPMDDCVSACTIDLGGRAYLNFKAKFSRNTVGQFPTELTEEFFRALASGMKANIYIKADGKNDHHKIESIFKSFAKALNEACRLDERASGKLPSTKGIL